MLHGRKSGLFNIQEERYHVRNRFLLIKIVMLVELANLSILWNNKNKAQISDRFAFCVSFCKKI